MIINWLAIKAQQLLAVDDASADEFSFDFALSAEIAELLYAHHQTGQPAQARNVNVVTQFTLDEHELALTC